MQQVREELADVAQFIRLEPVHGGVLLLEDRLERLHVLPVKHTEALREETEELLVRALLSATVQHHVAQLHLTACKKNRTLACTSGQYGGGSTKRFGPDKAQ